MEIRRYEQRSQKLGVRIQETGALRFVFDSSDF